MPAKLRTLALFVGLAAGCATTAPSSRMLHEVDGEVVYSRPPSPGAYEAYLRARLALDADPPRPEEALGYLEQLQRTAPHDPHLWATKAEALALLGDYDEARAAAQRSLSISPEYPKAQRVLAGLPGSASSAAR